MGWKFLLFSYFLFVFAVVSMIHLTLSGAFSSVEMPVKVLITDT